MTWHEHGTYSGAPDECSTHWPTKLVNGKCPKCDSAEHTMTHTDALNLILAHACPMDIPSDDVRTFHIDTHCVSFLVTARLTSTYPDIAYDIIDCEVGE